MRVRCYRTDDARSRTIDIHAHLLPPETIRRLGREFPRVAPKLIAQGDGSTIMEIAGKVVQRPMPPQCWNLDLRIADMDKHGIDMQAICATVHRFFYDEEPSLGAACAVLQNDEIAAVVSRDSDRFVALATLPLQDPQRAADELRRALRVLGLRGAQIGSNVNGRNLDDPALEPVWAVANELRAFILVHRMAKSCRATGSSPITCATSSAYHSRPPWPARRSSSAA
jgi:aminocarboxymuconate-semialdehyde decarboxylase